MSISKQDFKVLYEAFDYSLDDLVESTDDIRL